MNKENGDSNRKNSFDSFQLEEYKNISVSHYESLKQISTFFQYYLLTLGAPAFIFGLVVKKDGGLDNFFLGREIPIYYDFVFYYFITVSFVGFCIYLYVINLRHDAILYAKAVNKVRRYFYEKSDLSISDFSHFAHLPTSASKPQYSEKTFFTPLLLVFSLINCGMFIAAFAFKTIHSRYFIVWEFIDIPISKLLIITLSLCLFAVHIICYFHLANRRNNHYLKSYTIGIDIDGVLNNQTQHFAEWLKRYTQKELDLTALKELPVSLNKNINVTDFEEKLIFNTKEYWETLKLKENAVKRINEFHKRFGLKVSFFSYRDWPQYSSNDKNRVESEIRKKGYTPLEKGQIKTITEAWLNQSGIEAIVINKWYRRLIYHVCSLIVSSKSVVIETGNPYLIDTRYFNRFRTAILNDNRFQFASLKGFKFFIDDSPENAIKLSNLCEFVFLFNEPYNQAENYTFSKNVIRVKSWNEIYHHLKSMS